MPLFGWIQWVHVMSQASSSTVSGRIVRPRLLWRLLLLLVVMLGGFLYLCLVCLGGYLVIQGFDVEYPLRQRLMALGGGGLILLVGLWLLKVAMPRRITPVLIESQR